MDAWNLPAIHEKEEGQMKRYLSLLLSLLLCLSLMPLAAPTAEATDSVAISADTFPDSSFRAFVETNLDDDGSGSLDPEEIAAVTQLDVHGRGISSLCGVELFTSLEKLYCQDNGLTALDVSKNPALRELWCYGNRLAALDLRLTPYLAETVESGVKTADSGEGFDQYAAADVGTLRVDSAMTPETKVPLTAAYFPNWLLLKKAEKFDKDGDGLLSRMEAKTITSMDVSGYIKSDAMLKGVEYLTELTYLNASNCRLETVDLSRNTKLTALDVSENFLTSLDLSNNTELVTLRCSGNQLASLQVGSCTKLTEIWAGQNFLTSIDVSASPSLKQLQVETNQLTELDLSRNTRLEQLECYDNPIAVLDLRKNELLTEVYNTAQRYEYHDPVTSRTFWNYCSGTCHLYVDKTTSVNTKPVEPPVITQQPQDVTADWQSRIAKFNISVENGAITYRWQYKALSGAWHDSTGGGASSNTLSVEPKLHRDGYQYRCVVTNAAGTVISDAATLHITGCSVPAIVTQPESVSAPKGASVSFTAAASGGNLKYQWQYLPAGDDTWHNCTASGAKTTSLTVTAELYRDGYRYRCIVTDSKEAHAISDVVTLTVTSAGKPVVTTQPSSVTAGWGTTARFTVIASGSDLRYQWQYLAVNSDVWSNCTTTGAGTATLSVRAENYRSGYRYRCVVTNDSGRAVSGAAVLTVSDVGKPVITAQYGSVTAVVGTTARFAVTATGTDLSYRWQYQTAYGTTWDDCVAEGAGTAMLSIRAESHRDGYRYRCVVANADGTATSNIVTLRVSAEGKATITAQPMSVTAGKGSTVRFTVSTSGTVWQYQWQYLSPGNLEWYRCTTSGARTDTLTVSAQDYRSGYRYRCVITDESGKVISAVAKLTVVDTEGPIIHTQPKDVSAEAGSTAQFTVGASGSDLTYQWQYLATGSDVWYNCTTSGAKTATLSVPAQGYRNGYQYRCVVTDGDVSAISTAARLTVK